MPPRSRRSQWTILELDCFNALNASVGGELPHNRTLLFKNNKNIKEYQYTDEYQVLYYHGKTWLTVVVRFINVAQTFWNFTSIFMDDENFILFQVLRSYRLLEQDIVFQFQCLVKSFKLRKYWLMMSLYQDKPSKLNGLTALNLSKNIT